MFHTARLALRFGLVGIALTAVSFVMHATVPTGWYIAGSKPNEYEAGVDANAA